MPTICSFFGIFIRMYHDEHNPPHFHVYYGEYEAIINIQTLEVMEGYLPKRANSMVVEWAIQYRKDLLLNWNKAVNNEPLAKIEPLE